MQGDAYLKCIEPHCGLEYPIMSINVECEKGHLLDVKYKNKPSDNLKKVFYQRRDSQENIFNESGVWRFRELLNFCQIDTENINECSKYLVSLDGSEGRQSKPYQMSKVAEFIGISNNKLWLQPEGYNPSGSFKDNGMATAVTHAKMVGAKKIVCASTGNTSASAGMFAANEGINCDVYIPSGQIAPGKLSQAYQFGAQIIQVDGNFDDALKQSLDDAKNHNGYTVNSVNPFRIEGQKTIPYRALEYLRWEAPDWIVYPGGALGNTSSCGKALMELYQWGWIKKMPRIAVINSEGASTLSDLYNGKFEGEELRWNKGNTNTELISRYYDHLDKEGIRPKTKATAIQIGRPANILKGLRALEFTNGVVTTVSDAEMLDGMAVVGLNGFDCEMASGASVVGIKKLISEEIIKKDDVVVGILTGRQKDAMLPVEYHNNPKNKFAIPPKN
ncbi:MAG: threonine synthase [Nitrosopumilales archaeon CG11_big_fil_rev_8_21_14_0_20_33_24]|nr:MAG: threonine synthase [Nitrosopumilales archaeon CG11_big_fil_rev_8_21_14_0_20_33_24]PJB98096.1 MAG: threonine synthase [Nitrosopumilales archaeon CG_4_9_14_0_8_um_filter_34_10]